MTDSQRKRVLVPLDGSALAEAALEEALRLFPEADVHVLHVVQVKKAAGDDTKSGYQLAVETAGEVREAAEVIASRHERDVETDAIEGHAAKAIVGYAETHDIDHIVMGSRGRSGLKRILLGSVAAGVVREAPSPVTVVSARRQGTMDRTEGGRILVPIDRSPEGTVAVRTAFETFPGAVFTVALVNNSVTGLGESDERSSDGAEQWQTEARDRTKHTIEMVEVLADEHDADVSIVTLTEPGHRAILTCAEAVDANHIVIENWNRPRLTEAFFGSVSEAIVRRSSVPVTVIR